MKLNTIIKAAENSAKTKDQKDKLEDMIICYDGYCEPRYKCEKNIVVLADWNDLSKYNKETGKFDVEENVMGRLFDILEKQGYGCEWSDEWTMCDECGKLYRIVENSYHWTMYGHFMNDSSICGDCIKKDPKMYLQDIANNYKSANLILSDADLEKQGFTQINGIFENGWYGTVDKPEPIFKALRKQIKKADILFSITSVSQFNLNFTVWGKLSEKAIDNIDLSKFHADYRQVQNVA